MASPPSEAPKSGAIEDKKAEPATNPSTSDRNDGLGGVPDAADTQYHYRGRVVDPAGKPVAGAKLFLVYWKHGSGTGDAVKPRAVTDAQGTFDFTVKRSEFEADGNEELDSQVFAVANGFGFAAAASLDFEKSGELLKQLPLRERRYLAARPDDHKPVLRLAPDDVPIAGRVLSIEGRPVGGARIRVKELSFNDQGSLDSWERAAKEPKADYYSLRNQAPNASNGPQLPAAIPDAVADADGRFTLTGIGRERIVQMLISGPGIETELVTARTRKGDKVVVPEEWRTMRAVPGMIGEPGQATYHGASFIHVAGPSKPVNGRITDADTGKPLAGVQVSAGTNGTFTMSGKPYIAATSDADGKYHLEGLAIGKEEKIYVVPPGETNYLPAAAALTVQPVGPDATRDFRLKSGVWVRGKVVDDRTGEPLSGRVRYFAFDDNPHVKSYPGFSGVWGYERRADRAGRFQIAVAPGPGVIAFMADDHARFRRGLGAETLTGPVMSAGKDLMVRMFRTSPGILSPGDEELVRQIAPEPGSPPIELTLALTSGIDVVARLLDPDGKPLSGGIVDGSVFEGSWYPIQGETFRIEGYYPDRPRELLFFHADRNLAGHYRLEGQPPNELAIRLEPAGTIRGRLLDVHGAPLAGIRLRGTGVPGDNSGDTRRRLSTDDAGRFEIRGLIPGRKYTVTGDGDGTFGRVLIDATVEAGKIKDAGDVTLQPPEPTTTFRSPADPTTAEMPDGTTRLSGTVLSPDGKPAAGAHVVLVGELRQGHRPIDFAADHSVVVARKQCDAAGRFELMAADLSSQRYRRLKLLARSAESGLAWLDVNPDDPNTSFSITLPEAAQARGRLVTLEGRPAAGVHITVLGVGRSGTIGTGLYDGVYADHVPEEVWPIGVVTDADGWFIVRGVAADAELGLHVDQEPYAPERWTFDTTATDPAKRVRALTLAQIIKGVVVAADTGKPIANAPIDAMQKWELDLNHGMMNDEGKTDAEGRFRVNPYAAGAYTVTAMGPQGTPYLAKQIEFKWNETEREHELRIELPRGVLVRGTITEEPSGQPVAKATVRYTARTTNAHASGIPLGMYQPTELSDEQGRFSIAVPAGAGHLTVKSATGEHVLKELDARQIAEGRPGWQRLYVNADAAIDLADDAREQSVQFKLLRGATVKGELVRSDGQPPRRVLMVHRGLMLPQAENAWMYNPTLLAGNRFEIHGVPPDGELPVFLLDPDAKQGKRLAVHASDAGKPMRVELEPCGSLTMRFLDPEGKPVAGHNPSLMIVFTPGKPSFDLANTAAIPRSDETFIQNFDRVNCREVVTDETGRVTIPTLIPGVVYRLLEIGDKDQDQTRWKYREITVKPSERLELPDTVIRNPDVLRYAEERRMQKQKGHAAKAVSAASAAKAGELPKQMPTGTFSAVEAPTIEKAMSYAAAEMPQRSAAPATSQLPLGHASAVEAPTIEKAMSDAAAQMKSRTSTPATREKPSDTINDDLPLRIRGQVVGPDGKPVAGAKLFLLHWNSGRAPEREVKPWAVTNAEGRFEFAVKRSDFGLAKGNDWVYSRIVATAEGFGIAVGLMADFDLSGNFRRSQPPQVIEYFSQRLTGKQPVLRLAPDDAPLTGRIVSLEGQPIAGARIALKEISINEQGSLDDWEKAAKEPQADFYSLRSHAGLEENAPQLSLIVPAATTDRDGRFTLHGVGRERIARLTVSGTGIETKLIRARTRNGEKVVVPDEWRRRADGSLTQFYPNGFTHVAAPSNAVVGKVTDRETGKPLAGVTVMSQKLHGIDVEGWGQDFIRTVTNADGEYRLEGMPLGDDNKIGAFTLDQPYLPIKKRARIDVGSKPVKLDFQLPHGIWVEGRVTDKITGKPLSGTVEYFVFNSNPNYEKLGRTDGIDVDLREFHRASADGRFRIPAFPGRGIIGVLADDSSTYSFRGAGAEKIEGGDTKSVRASYSTSDTKSRALMFPTAPYFCAAFNFNALAEIDPPESADVVKLDLTLSSGATVTGKLIDADGKPVIGALYCGESPAWENNFRSTEQDSFQVNSYEPNMPRRLVFYAPKRNLAGQFMLKGDPPKELVVRLKPAGSVRGRLVDEHGSPLAGAMLFAGLVWLDAAHPDAMQRLPIPPSDPSNLAEQSPTTDEQGNFGVHGLIPGQEYRLGARDGNQSGFHGIFPDLISVHAGETKDLGDVTPSPINSAVDVEAMNAENKAKAKSNAGDGAKLNQKDGSKSNADRADHGATSASASRNDSAQTDRKADDDMLSVRGRVVDPHGKPVAGAEVTVVQGYWRISRTSVPLISVKSDATGRFHLEFHKSQFVAYRIEPWRAAVIVASSPDAKLGAAWRQYDSIKLGDEITLELVPDEPIEGRIVDLEGKPIAGAEVKTTDLSTNAKNDLTAWLGALKSGIPFFGSKDYDEPNRYLPAEFASQWKTKTDSDGRFRLTGLGRDRVAAMDVSGAGMVSANLRVVTRPMESIKVDMTSRSFPDSSTYYGSHFQFAVEPSQPIEGVVRDAKTGQPLGGVRVISNKFAGRNLVGIYSICLITSVTDERGNYRLEGMPKGAGNGIVAMPADGQPYFIREFDVPTAPGFQPVKLDLDLHRGALIHGRVSDKVTGESVEGAWMHYIPWPDNPNISGMSEFGHGWLPGPQDRYQTDRDGRFTLVGLPGRGLIEVQYPTRPFPSGQGLGEIADLPTPQQFLKVAGGLTPGPRFPTAVKETHIGDGDDQVRADIELDPGKRLTLKIVDPDGEALSGVKIGGLLPRPELTTHEDAGPTADVLALSPDEKRLLLLYQKERNLGKAIRVCWNDDGGGPITVKLEPCGTLKARLLDKHGDPVRGGSISIWAEGGAFALSLPGGATDSDGRLNYTTLLPGHTYAVSCECAQVGLQAVATEKLTVSPGETIDLGEFDVTSKDRPKPTRTTAAMRKTPSKSTVPASEKQ